MELWIRTQDKKDLIKVDYISYEIAIEDKHILWYKSIDLGTYKTKERAIEILDEIQNILKPIIHYEPITREKIDYTKPYVQTEQIGSKSVIQELSTYVYEMPKE